jgi:hypothetical protein
MHARARPGGKKKWTEPCHLCWPWQDGGNGLYLAALNGHKDVGQLLLENNADVNAKNTV